MLILPRTIAFVYFRAQTETVKKLKRSDFDSQKGMEKIIIVLDHQFFRAYNGKVKQYENRINCGKYKYTNTRHKEHSPINFPSIEKLLRGETKLIRSYHEEKWSLCQLCKTETIHISLSFTNYLGPIYGIIIIYVAKAGNCH